MIQKNELLTLKDREWTCANCGAEHDRDVNAAKNIRNFAIKNSGRGTPGEPVESPAIAGAEKQETVKLKTRKGLIRI